MIRKYAINTVRIAHLGTNHETIQVNMYQSLRACIKACGSQKWITVKLDVCSLEWDDTRCVTYA